jgi:tetratricopeptide (TPR) repeat protein
MAIMRNQVLKTPTLRDPQSMRILAVVLALAAVSGCHGSVNSEKLSKVEYAKKAPYETPDAPSQRPVDVSDPSNSSQLSAEVNMAKEQAVADGCLAAWRKAYKDKDEEGAMKMLEELDKKYTGISTVQFMMGQVKDYFHKPKEALEHYKRAHSTNEFSSMQTFKLAEATRKAGDAKGSIVYYKKLLENLDRATTDYSMSNMEQLRTSVRLGLVKAYKDCKQSNEARVELDKILKVDANNAEAKSLLKELENTGK